MQTIYKFREKNDESRAISQRHDDVWPFIQNIRSAGAKTRDMLIDFGAMPSATKWSKFVAAR